MARSTSSPGRGGLTSKPRSRRSLLSRLARSSHLEVFRRRPMSVQYYYAQAGQSLGPVSADELKQLASSRQLCSDDPVWVPELQDWVLATAIPGLFDPPADVPMAAVAYQPAPGTILPWYRKPAIVGPMAAGALLLFVVGIVLALRSRSRGPLDRLNPTQIVEAERLPQQPKELVAVIRTARVSGKSRGFWLALSQDGRWLATSGTDAVVRLWSMETMQQVAALDGHTRPVLTVAFSPDSKLVATGGGDQTVRLWEVREGTLKERATLTGHQGTLWGVAFSPDSKRLASAGGADKSVRIWDLSEPEPKLWGAVHADDVDAYSAAFAPDGKSIAVGGTRGIVRMYDVSKKLPGEARKLVGQDSTYPLAFSPDGKTLAAGDHRENAVILWDLSEGKPRERGRLLTESKGYASLSFSPDGKRLA